jgi:hypothetical protein
MRERAVGGRAHPVFAWAGDAAQVRFDLAATAVASRMEALYR